MWVQRFADLLSSTVGVPVLIEDSLFSVSRIAESLLRPDGRCLWIEFETESLEQLQSTAWGLPITRSVLTLDEALRLHADLLNVTIRPILVLTRVENAPSVAAAILESHESYPHQIIISGDRQSVRQLSRTEQYRLLQRRELGVTRAEVQAYLYRSEVSHMEIEDSLLDLTYEEMVDATYERLGLPKPERPSPRLYSSSSACITKEKTDLVTLLIRNRKWLFAFEVAASHGSEALSAVIDEIGEHALHSGQIRHFYKKLCELTPEYRLSEEILCWFLIAEHHLGVTSKVAAEVERLRETSTCPRLKVLLNTLALEKDDDPAVLELVANASPEQLAPLLHMQAFRNPSQNTTRGFKKLIRYFESNGRVARQVRTMSLLVNALILQGRYQQAAALGGEAYTLAHKKKLGALERAVTASGAAFANVLIGEFELASQFMSTIHRPEMLIGRPSGEAVVSTVAEKFIVAGHYQTALYWLELGLAGCKGIGSDLLLPDYALVLTRLGRAPEALPRIQDRYSHLVSSDVAYPWVLLAFAIVESARYPQVAQELFRALLDDTAPGSLAPLRARAGILLALLRDSWDGPSLQALESVETSISQLAEPGWVLMSGGDPRVSGLRKRWLERSNPVVMRFLGEEYWSFQSASSDAKSGLRLKELLLVLAQHPDGLSGDQLAELMEWGYEGQETVRSNIRRLRNIIPIGSRPYRLLNRVEADFIQFQTAVEAGDIDAALSLYRGPLLHSSELRFVQEQRFQFETSLRVLVVNHGTPDQLKELALRVGDDIELLELALSRQNAGSSSATLLEARLRVVSSLILGEKR